ncbi:MAG: DNA adenine methylase [Candidatus Aenigmatarchaeota archaeon]
MANQNQKNNKLLLPPYASQGGHPTKLVKELLKLIPEHEIFIEPLFGGGSIFWSKPKAKLEIINDIDPILTNFLKQLQNANIQKLNCNMTPSKEKFKEIRKRGVKTICDFLYLNKHSYAGSMKSFAHRTICKDDKCGIKRLRKNLDKYKERLRNVKIETLDFRDLLKKYKHLDGPNTFYFVNPPYPTFTKERGCKWDHGCGMNPQIVKDAIKDLKGKIMITESDDPKTREVFCNDPKFKCIKTITTKGGACEKRKCEVKHLIITNY